MVFKKQELDHRPSEILCHTSRRQNHWSLIYSRQDIIPKIFEGDYLNIFRGKHCFPQKIGVEITAFDGIVPVIASSSNIFINRVLSKWAVKYASLGVAKKLQAKRAYRHKTTTRVQHSTLTGNGWMNCLGRLPRRRRRQLACPPPTPSHEHPSESFLPKKKLTLDFSYWGSLRLHIRLPFSSVPFLIDPDPYLDPGAE